MKKNIAPEGGFRTTAEQEAGQKLAKTFEDCPDTIEVKLDNFNKYIRRQKLTRLLVQYEIFKKILPVKGSVIECGVYHGAGLMGWAHLSSILEPVNLTRRIYGFDTFEGFPSILNEDKGQNNQLIPGTLASSSYDELKRLIKIYDSNRFLGHINKIQIIKGDATKTIPKFIKANKHLVVSLLFLDFDLYEPTKIAIENFYPRMPKGAIIAFDEIDNPIWPGETLALLNTIGINSHKLERIEFDPYICYAVID